MTGRGKGRTEVLTGEANRPDRLMESAAPRISRRVATSLSLAFFMLPGSGVRPIIKPVYSHSPLNRSVLNLPRSFFSEFKNSVLTISLYLALISVANCKDD